MTTRLIPPMPKGLPLVGHVLEFAKDPPGYLMRVSKSHGEVVNLNFGNRNMTIVTRPDLVALVLRDYNKKFKKPYRGFPALKALVGNGLLSSDGDFWLRQRRLAQPAFHREKIKAYGETMRLYTLRALEKIPEKLDVFEFWNSLTLEIVAKTLFNAEISGQGSRVGHALEEALQANRAQMGQPIPLPLSIPLPGHKRLKAAIAELDSITLEIIAKERAHPSEYSLLSMLVSARDEDGSQMNDEQLRDEALTLLLAGHETTANALSWAVSLLLDHPSIMKAACEEARTVLSTEGCRLEDIPKLPLIKQIWQETLRLYPPAWSIGRTALEDVQLGEYLIPKGQNLILSQYVTQRSPKYFTDPDSFKPERWVEGYEKSLPDYAYFPFSAGPRVCIGNMFADMEGMILLSTVLSQINFIKGDDYKIEIYASLTMRPKHGVSVLASRQS
jgi:cytochrome P450